MTTRTTAGTGTVTGTGERGCPRHVRPGGTIPRWSREPDGGERTHTTPVPGGLVATVHRLAAELSVPTTALLLAAHARVLAALTGEPEVLTGSVVRAGDGPRPGRIDTGSRSWRALATAAARVEADLRDEPGPADRGFETVLDPYGRGGDLAGAVLRVELDGDGRTLRLRYRSDVLDADAAARTAGYHLTALRLLATDPDAPCTRGSLLGAEELRLQIHGLAGPHRDLPGVRAHELFAQQVRAHPDAVAVVRGERRWTYAELDERADRLARALLARGLDREGVVAVVTERTLDWAAAVLAVLRAGGVYLPVEPHFPAGRIATTLARAGCRLVLTETGSTTTLDAALHSLPGVDRLLVDAAYAEDHGRGDLGVTVAPDQLAYLYFTSGSTGEPKGAMCEHAGMLNHLLAKIDDLGVGAGRVVAQTAPPCFDISLWQLVSALMVGGTTLIVEQEVILDVPRFVDTLVAGRVAVLQVVPSYLDVVVSSLERHPRELPDLRCVSVTGEALKKELVQRWFAVRPGIPLVNAYGLTETSDDTNHAVMHRAPDHDRVPIGPPIANVAVYVVDEQLSPVPLGAPGEIVHSGVCVGRGYVNDPERTRQAFLPDPHRPGERLYRGGDHGRWLPDGSLAFLGRRDDQVKISGFRIEIGEIENALLRVPGVRDGAVVVVERADRSKQLVGFYAGSRPLAVDLVRDVLGASLPAYMVPGVLHWRAELPLTANGKIDTLALTALAGELGAAEEDHLGPRTPTERRLAAAWSAVLGLDEDRIGSRDHFFDRGASSLTAVKLAVALGRTVSLSDIARHPVLADLAALMDGRSAPRAGLLQALSEPGEGTAGTLVCFPHAGGHAVNFQPLARALRGSGLAVHAVELPGHDPSADAEPFASLDAVVDRVVAEIVERALPGVLLWGHSAGGAFALETARRLQEGGIDVRRVFLGAQLLGSAAARRADVAELTARTDAELAAGPAGRGGVDRVAGLDRRRVQRVGAAYRHDCLAAHQHLVGALDRPPATRLAVPVTVVVAADDPSTVGSRHRCREWELVAERVDLHELADGGHHFLRTSPAEAARAVRVAVGPPSS